MPTTVERNSKTIKLLVSTLGSVLLSAAAFNAWHTRKKRTRLEYLLEEYRSKLDLRREDLLRVCDAILEQMDLGLEGKPGGLMMLPSFVDRFPKGTEQGEYFAIDLGGTSLKIVRVVLEKQQVVDKHVKEWKIPEECYDTDNGMLMEWVVDKCLEMIGKENGKSAKGTRIVIGFCYSFACKQNNLDHGEQILWTKKFRGQGLLGQNVVQVLRDTFKKRNVNAVIPALMNDSVASLVGAQFESPLVKSSVILGTGTNCSYIESVDKIKTLPKSYRKHGDYMIINTEWGDCKIFDHDIAACGLTHASGIQPCEEDLWVDFSSANPGHGLFEKLISGLYIGDVARRILLKLAEETGIYGGVSDHSATGLATPHSFDGARLSAIYHDDSPDLKTTRCTLQDAFNLHHSMSVYELQVAKSVCTMVARRSARLCAAAMVAILRREFENAASPSEKIEISVDGSTFTKFDGYRQLVRETIDELLDDPSLSSRVAITLAHGSSVIGAAVVAAVETSS
ncbi:hypothetical protein M9435_005450 [Picochlorum sp. BPE23]|nr:hypothetical protein M9435_005450 [Picochlorum sp. BPE23]